MNYSKLVTSLERDIKESERAMKHIENKAKAIRKALEGIEAAAGKLESQLEDSVFQEIYDGNKETIEQVLTAMHSEVHDIKKRERKRVKQQRAELNEQLFIVRDEYRDEHRGSKRKSI